MTQPYHRKATVEFAINGTDQTLTVNDLPYIWIPAANPDMDQEGVFAAMDYLRKHIKGLSMQVIYVSTSPRLTKNQAILQGVKQ